MLDKNQSKILEEYGERTGEEVDPAVAANALEEIRDKVASGVPETVPFGTEIDAEWLEPLVLADPDLKDKVTISSPPTGPNVLATVNEGSEDLATDEENQAARDQARREEEIRKEREERSARLEEVEDKGDDFLAARYRFAEQCYLMDNLASLAENHRRSQNLPNFDGSGDRVTSYGILPNYKYNKVHILEGNGSSMLNKLKFRKSADALLDASPAELSSLIPMIKLFKVVYEGKLGEEGPQSVDYEIPFTFLNHTLTSDAVKRDIAPADQKYLQPASGRSGVGIKSFDWEYIATNPDTIRNDIKAKLILYFQSFDDLIICRNAVTPDGDNVKYRYLDLIVHAGGSSVCDQEQEPEGSNEDDVPDEMGCGTQLTDYDSSFYEIRAVVGWAANNSEALSLDLKKSITENQTAIYLTLEEHEFGIQQDGTFTLTIHYRGRLEGILTSPKANILNPSLVPHQDSYQSEVFGRLVDIQLRIARLKESKICGDDEEFGNNMGELQDEKVRLEDELRNLSYKKFASALEDPTTRYADQNYPSAPLRVLTATSPGITDTAGTTGTAVTGTGNREPTLADGPTYVGMPLIYSIGVTRSQIERFVTLGRGKRTPGADIAGGTTDAPARIRVPRATEGVATQELEDTILDSQTDIDIHYRGDHSDVPDDAKYSLKDYSILDIFDPDVPLNDPGRDPETGSQRPGTDVLNFFYLGDLIDIIATDVFNNTQHDWLARYQDLQPDGYSDSPPDFTTSLGTREDTVNYSREDKEEVDTAAKEAAQKAAFHAGEVENLRVLLGPVEYIDPLEPSKVKRINMADIPISFRLFVEFCQRRIIRKRRHTYPFMDFIRDMVQDLVLRAMGAECFGRNGARGLRIRTAFIEGPAEEQTEGQFPDPIEAKAYNQTILEQGVVEANARINNTKRLDMDKFETSKPFFDFSRSVQTKDTYQYLFIYAEGPAGLLHPSLVDPDDPRPPEKWDRQQRGIHHLHIGRDRGLVKTINFTKTDVPGMREARVEKSGTFDPIAQLSDVYEVTMTMFGNTVFYPGSYVYINPFGLASHKKGGASKLGLPHVRTALSNVMGLGGYHIIINVSNYIEGGKFETTFKARFEASGDGCKITAAESNNDTDCPETPANTATSFGNISATPVR